MCTLLASVLGRVPSQILRSKFNASVQVIQQIVEQSDQQVYIVMLVATKQLLQCGKAMLPISPANPLLLCSMSITLAAKLLQIGFNKTHGMQAGSLRPALHCLSYITAAVNPAEWAPALRPFTLLLRYSTDARPKVRKRAQYGLVDVLAALQGAPALQGASDAVLHGQ